MKGEEAMYENFAYSFKDEKQIYTNGTILVPLYRVLDAILQDGNEYQSN